MSEHFEPRGEGATVATGQCPACQAPRSDLSAPCPRCGAPPAADAAAESDGRRGAMDVLMQVRASDIEPYIGLRYLSKLFKLMAVLLVLLLIAEIITGFVAQGSAAIPTLLGEASRLIVFAGLLWGAGDLAILLIDIGHDLRATRILMTRQAAHHIDEHHPEYQGPRRRAGEREAQRHEGRDLL